jgi:hypothetical protein
MENIYYAVLSDWEPYKGASCVTSLVAVFDTEEKAEAYADSKRKALKPKDYSTEYYVEETPFNPSDQK